MELRGRRTRALREVLTVVAVVLLLVALSRDARAIEGCDNEEQRDKIVIASVEKLVGEVDEGLRRRLIASFEMRFEKANTELEVAAQILYCEHRPVRKEREYEEGVVSVLNDERVLLEVGTTSGTGTITVTYLVVPVRYYQHFIAGDPQVKGYHTALYDESSISAGLEALFRNNAELRLMAALALALRHEKLASAEPDPAIRRGYINLSRGLYCDAIGSIAAAEPAAADFGLTRRDWLALRDFAFNGAERLFAAATSDQDYVGGLSVVESERAGEPTSPADCLGRIAVAARDLPR